MDKNTRKGEQFPLKREDVTQLTFRKMNTSFGAQEGWKGPLNVTVNRVKGTYEFDRESLSRKVKIYARS